MSMMMSVMSEKVLKPLPVFLINHTDQSAARRVKGLFTETTKAIG